jgi:hypothetical protein
MRRSNFVCELEKLGFKFKLENRQSTIEGGLAGILELVQSRKSLLATVSEKNRYQMNSALCGDDEAFKGGSLADLEAALSGKVDMQAYLQAKRRFSESKLGQRLNTVTQDLAPRRKRFTSEHDGEWDYGRQWEITPFYSTSRAFAPARTVRIMADFSISARAKADEIDRYGVMVWALSDMIESTGVMTEVCFYNAVTGCAYGPDTDGKTIIKLKRAGEYIAPSLLAAAFKANFFRRAGFAMIATHGEVSGGEVSGCLGSPVRSNVPIEFGRGELWIRTNATTGYDGAIEREILKAVGADQKEGAA